MAPHTKLVIIPAPRRLLTLAALLATVSLPLAGTVHAQSAVDVDLRALGLGGPDAAAEEDAPIVLRYPGSDEAVRLQPRDLRYPDIQPKPRPEPVPDMADAEPELQPESAPVKAAPRAEAPKPVAKAEPKVEAPAPKPAPEPEKIAKADPAPVREEKPAPVAKAAPAPEPQAATPEPEAAPQPAPKKPKVVVVPTPPADPAPAAKAAPEPATPPAAASTPDPRTQVASAEQAMPSALNDDLSPAVARIPFESESAAIQGTARAELDAIAGALRDDPRRIQLRAYGGTPGDVSSGARRLSLKRGLAVRAYLIDQGVDSTRIDVRALGGVSDTGAPDRVDVTYSEG